MITRTSQPASGAMLISEMKEFAGFTKATQRYIRRSLDVAYGRRDAVDRSDICNMPQIARYGAALATTGLKGC